MISRKIMLGAGLGILIATNAVALTGVAYNRSGEPESKATLTERELRLPYGWEWRGDENSGIALRLHYRTLDHERDKGSPYQYYSEYSYGHPAWLDKEKLHSLGFDVTRPTTTERDRMYYEKQHQKPVFLVLELGGNAHAAAIERAERIAEEQSALAARNPGNKDIEERRNRAVKHLESERNTYSRLFAIDAGLDIDELRAKYPDRARYLIVRGMVDIQATSSGVFGRIQGLSVDTVHVPYEYRSIVEPLLDRRLPEEHAPRYEVTLAYGKRLEPWIVGVSRLEK